MLWFSWKPRSTTFSTKIRHTSAVGRSGKLLLAFASSQSLVSRLVGTYGQIFVVSKTFAYFEMGRLYLSHPGHSLTDPLSHARVHTQFSVITAVNMETACMVLVPVCLSVCVRFLRNHAVCFITMKAE
jgi:hypothetical protein